MKMRHNTSRIKNKLIRKRRDEIKKINQILQEKYDKIIHAKYIQQKSLMTKMINKIQKRLIK